MEFIYLDWTSTITICDKSLPAGIKARFFQKLFDYLPAVSSVGDVVILTNMRVSMYMGEAVLLSAHGFSWVANCVRQGQKPLIKKHPTSSSSFTIQVNNYITHLRSWWVINLKDKSPTGSVQSSAVSGSVTNSGGSRRKFELVKNMQLNTFYDMVGEVIKTFTGVTTDDFDNFTVYITDYTSNPMLYNYKMDIDESEGRGDKWNGPWGKYTLQVTLWDNNAAAARRLLREGSFIQITNMRARENRDGNLEGWVHGDKKYKDKINFYTLDEQGDYRVIELIARKKEYTRKFNENLPLYKAQMRKKKEEEEREAMEEEAREAAANELAAKEAAKEEEERLNREQEELERKEKRKEPKKDQRKEVLDQGSVVINASVRSQRPEHNTTLIGEIKKPTAGDIESYRNKKYRAVCRIIDFMPERVEDFTRVIEDDQTNQDSDEEIDIDRFNGVDVSKKWIWRFALLVEGLDGELMPLIVDGKDADHLLKLTATE